jgi:hypothetical protein
MGGDAGPMTDSDGTRDRTSDPTGGSGAETPDPEEVRSAPADPDDPPADPDAPMNPA